MYQLEQNNGKWGFIAQDGRKICEFKYDSAREFKNGFAAVELDGKWGFIAENGEIICEIRYDEVGDFDNKLSAVRREGRMSYMNERGEEIRVTNFMDEEMEFDGCKSCAIGDHTITNMPGGYIYDDGVINVTIDPEIPIKGFIVIGVRRHLASTTQMTKDERLRIEEATNTAKIAMEDLGIKQILVFEDGFSEHYRRWVIAVDDWMFQFGRGKNLKQITLYAKQNMNLEEKKEMLAFAEEVKKFF